MRRLLKKIGLTAGTAAPPSRGSIRARLDRQLARLGEDRLEHLAAFAGLLVRAAYGDAEVSAAEAKAVVQTLRERAGLSEPDARLVLDIVRHETESLSGIEDYLLTRAFNRHSTQQEKENLIDCLYAVTAADDMISDGEDREIRRIAAAFLIPRSRLLAIRTRYRERLETVRRLRS